MGLDEAYAFAVLRSIIEKFELTRLYNTDLPMMKLMFYQLDRLIAIYLPDLHNHFKVSLDILLILKGRASECELL